MGMEQKVSITETPSWEKIVGLLAEKQFPVEMRMIDGQLAFPDETPPENWQELRVGTSQGMITLIRDANTLRLVTWGNADQQMIQAWNALTWACAETTGGTVLAEAGPLSPTEYLQKVSLPETFR